MAKSKHYFIRKAHRYLGVILGIQFLFWTLSGLYFSWSDMDEIHGEFEKKGAPAFTADLQLASPSIVLNQLKEKGRGSILSVQLVSLVGKPLYQVRYIITEPAHHHTPHVQFQLADAVTGELRGPLTREEAVALAISRFNGKEGVKDVIYLEKTDGHHEYRESPLPAYGITFNNAAGTTVYVASEPGTVQSFRNNKWRIFDYLWMTHTMDYQSRDDINNGVLRFFSVSGLITVVSGFALYFVSSKRFKRRNLAMR